MSILDELAGMQGRKDEEPNKELGKRLVETANLEGIKEAADNLRNEEKKSKPTASPYWNKLGCWLRN